MVCGASISGLLAARALADTFDSVTVVERDALPEGVGQRPGAPQGNHLHQLLSSGLRVLEEFFPGLATELLRKGAPALDTRDLSQAYLEIGGHALLRDGSLADPDALNIVLASRPLLESVVRDRVRALANVDVVDGHDAIGPVLRGGAVAALRVSDRATGRERELPADVIVDAGGRGGRTPAWLADNGFRRPDEHTYRVQLTYATQLFRVSADMHEKVAIISPSLHRPTGAGLIAYEADTVIFTLIGVAGHQLPTDRAGILAGADHHLPAHLGAMLRAAEPIGSVQHRRYPSSVWRRYDKLAALPHGLLVIGDAVCSLNPVYGQGMTSAALQARVLHKTVAETGAEEVGRAYFRAAAKRIAPLWQGNRLNDFAVTPVDGWARWPQRVFNAYTTRFMAVASFDRVLTETFLRVLQGVDSGPALVTPGRVARVAAGTRRGARRC
ncbi:2-polyprenyl-6-methoxyphenol hydroxylase-like oxidoreductase [Mycolicibacterium diernhoferi]|uniref:2-polyprenyl-6-methoxyphenol hydroxylase-like oxidoreductase n=1 Tax=Mycolicibacterium diernhoferi TaxID=1801 RepID=A0A2A7NPD9_9MYCO|nr:2-polyprenyl-6-methoxyphenol hydroxylase-like oxidoreductase [Mycolicibacterium diernhoferi]